MNLWGNCKKIWITIIVVSLLILIIPTSGTAESKTYYKDKVAVLMYHHIDSSFKSGATIVPELFEAQIEYLVNAGYNFISLKQFEEFLYEDKQIPKNSVLITFDDGYESYYKYAYPLLKKYNIPSVNAIIGTWIDRENGLPRLTSDELKELVADELVDIQNHTFDMHSKTKDKKPYLIATFTTENGPETKSEYIERISSDITKNKTTIEKITNEEVYAFVYPFGAYNRDSIKVVRETGHRLAFTVHNGMASKTTNPYLVPRINAGHPKVTPELLHESIIKLNPEFVNKTDINKSNPIKIYIDDYLVEFSKQQLISRNNITFVPVRKICNELGADVYWDSTVEKVIIELQDGRTVILDNNSEIFKIGDVQFKLASKPISNKGTTMVPIRFVQSLFDVNVEWDGINKRININSLDK